MSDDQQRPHRPDQADRPDRPVPPSAPEGGWGGEYDGDATAFIQLPGNVTGQYGPGYAGPGGTPEPLAAPGTGQGWTPPVIDPRQTPGDRPAEVPAAGADPAVPGQWTMPFAGGQAAYGTEAGGEPPRSRQQQYPPEPGAAAAMGQGAAAALAGSHEARTQQRRPLGEGPAREHGAPDTGDVASGGTPGGTDWSTAPAPGATGQWSIPFAAAGSPDDSGEYLASTVAGQPADGPGSAREPHREEPEGREAEHTRTAPEEPRPADHPAGPEAPEAGPEPGPEAAAEPGIPDVPEPSAVDSEHPHVSYVLRVNGADRPVADAWIGESLLYVLRERLGLAGAKDGCSQGECGACSVQVDGRLVASCLVPAATAAGSEVRTVEGLAENGMPCDVQRALAAHGAVQCGFCVPGMAMTLHDLLEGNHDPTELEARRALSGNLCRCSGYRGVLDAVRTVVAEREARSEEARSAREDGHPADPGGDRPGSAAADGTGTVTGEVVGGTAGNGSRVRIPHQAGPLPDGPPPRHRPPHDSHLPQDGGAQ
ncbi:2Fe-2S iron-sulfur cluster-binding protein [Streptomyces sp. TRM 70361]|uniref:2Fe-2S iron-sulfur cluster-binding protein n=1 Tax=Streptomyces sp. TRM 70361 TaxID=3116553 RepID=UPI002E7ABBF6|nr:2Fe-2S iron-sulfur cluster-binding protein [Streptomyces sp. TRM 70361]MEE1937868.1 2Fe-2S iron-sulfur cluster-binding protein [Streptomyces sp. TRM 70361]